MKYVKMLGLAAVAAAALMAFVGASSASATVLCTTNVTAGGLCPKGEGYSGEIHAVSETEKPTLTGTINIECNESTMKGNTTEGTGSPTETPNGAIATLTFTGSCTCEVVVVKTGTLEIHADGDTGNGTLTSSGAEVTVNCNTIFGKVHCIYVTEKTNVGTLTGSTTTKSTATLDTTAEIPQKATSGLCSSTAVWHAKYSVTTPDKLDVATATES